MRLVDSLTLGLQIGYLYPHLPRDLLLCGVATTPECGLLQQIPTLRSPAMFLMPS